MSASKNHLSVILETPRLLLREITAADAEFVLEMLNEPAFIRNVADRGVRTLADAAEYIAQKFEASYREFGFGSYAIELKETGLIVGMCGLLQRPTLADVDVGYAILERYWGRGFAYEAAAAVMQYGREKLGLSRIVGFTAPENNISIKLLEKLGLHFERMVILPGYETESKMFV